MVTLGGAEGGSLPAFDVGAIRRVRMENFMSYTDAVFVAGPRLNLVLGMNGSGKSTILCALCLGLGGRPVLLKRAETMQGYVKAGADFARVTIELHDPLKKNPVVVREWDSTRKATSSWLLHGKKTSEKKLKAFLKDNYQTQVDNVCQILPQDKVSHFGRLNEMELLHETVRAGLGESCIVEQQELAEMQQALASAATTARNEAELLKSKSDEVAKMRQRVESLEQREKLLVSLQLFKDKVKYVRFDTARTEYHALKAATKASKAELKVLDAHVHVTEAALEKQQAEMKKLEKKSLSNSDRKKLELAAKARNNFESYVYLQDEKMETCVDEVKFHGETLEKHRAQLTKAGKAVVMFKNGVSKWENDNDAAQLMLDTALTKEKAAKLCREMDQVQGSLDEVQSNHGMRFDELRIAQGRLQRLRAEAKNVEAVFDRIGGNGGHGGHGGSGGSSSSSSRVGGGQSSKYQLAWNALKQKMATKELAGPVFMPVLEVRPRTAQVAAFLERQVNPHKLCTLVTATQGDSATLHKVQGLDSVFVPRIAVPRRKVSEETMGKFHIEGYLDALLDGEPVVVQALRAISEIDRCLVGTQETEAALASLGNDQVLELFEGCMVLTPNQSLSVRRSRHGSRNATVAARPFRFFKPAVLFAQASAGSREKEVAQAEATVMRLQADVDALEKQAQLVRPRMAELAAAKQEQMHARQLVQGELAAYSRLRNQLMSAERKHQAISKVVREDEDDGGHGGGALKKNVDKFSECLGLLAHALAGVTQKFAQGIEANDHLLAARLRAAAARSALVTARTAHNDAAAKAQKMTHLHRTALARKDELHATAKQLGEEFKELDADMEALAELSEDIVELKASVQLTRARIKGISADASLLARYQKLVKDVAELRPRVEDGEKSRSLRREAFEERRGKWAARVEKLVKAVAANFALGFEKVRSQGYEVGGEVRLAKFDANVMQYGVEIRVRFRSGVEMQKLSIHTQSGGERSLTTFMYLLALNEVGKMPFRVVDEINQGMDAEKERIAMDLLIETTRSQFFLISPKLLTGLKLSQDVAVHIVFNGVGALSQKDCNIKDFVKNRLRLQEGSDSQSGGEKRKEREAEDEEASDARKRVKAAAAS